MLSYHSGIGMRMLSGYPFNRDVARQHLAGKSMLALVGAPVANFSLFQVSGKPVAQSIAAPSSSLVELWKRNLTIIFLRDVVALDDCHFNG